MFSLYTHPAFNSPTAQAAAACFGRSHRTFTSNQRRNPASTSPPSAAEHIKLLPPSHLPHPTRCAARQCCMQLEYADHSGAHTRPVSLYSAVNLGRMRPGLDVPPGPSLCRLGRPEADTSSGKSYLSGTASLALTHRADMPSDASTCCIKVAARYLY